MAEAGRLKAGRREGQLDSRGGTWRTRFLRTLHAPTGKALVHGAFLILMRIEVLGSRPPLYRSSLLLAGTVPPVLVDGAPYALRVTGGTVP